MARASATIAAPGEVSERPKERDWKSRRRDLSPRGFKSLPLRWRPGPRGGSPGQPPRGGPSSTKTRPAGVWARSGLPLASARGGAVAKSRATVAAWPRAPARNQVCERPVTRGPLPTSPPGSPAGAPAPHARPARPVTSVPFRITRRTRARAARGGGGGRPGRRDPRGGGDGDGVRAAADADHPRHAEAHGEPDDDARDGHEPRPGPHPALSTGRFQGHASTVADAAPEADRPVVFWPSSGQLAQRESARLTRGRSLVQSQYCPLAPAAPPIRESAVGEPPWVGCRQQHSVAVVAGTVFCDRGEGHIRLTYTAPQLTALSPSTALRIIARCGAARDQPQRGSRNRRARPPQLHHRPVPRGGFRVAAVRVDARCVGRDVASARAGERAGQDGRRSSADDERGDHDGGGRGRSRAAERVAGDDRGTTA